MEDPQLERYAEDVKQIARREREQAERLEQLLKQLHLYSSDLRKSLESEQQRSREIEDAYHDALVWLARAVALRDLETGRHADRLSHYCAILCRHLELSEAETRQIATAAPLHDVGKIGISDGILQKPGRLTPEEAEIMRSHCVIGANLLRGSGSALFETARVVALTHHERWDGAGYPQGLAGSDIPLCGRIVALADVYDVLRSTRPGKPAISHDGATRSLLEGDPRVASGHFDPDLLAAFAECEEEFAETFQRLGGR